MPSVIHISKVAATLPPLGATQGRQQSDRLVVADGRLPDSGPAHQIANGQ